MSEDEFAITVTRQAVARACIAFGLTKSSQPVIDSLADFVKSYIEALAVNALERAEAGGRAIIGLQDIIPAVEQTRPWHSNWKELRDFAFDDVKKPNIVSNSKWNQPFPYEIPDFPLASSKVVQKENIRLPKEPALKDPFIPSHLPAYPPAHTYKRLQQISKKRTAESLTSTGDDKASSSRPNKTPRKKSTSQSLKIIEDSIDNN